MADWKGKARSNYFEVKDEAAIHAWAETREVTLVLKTRDIGQRHDVRTFALFSNTEDGSWPSYVNDEEIEWINEISDHLPENEIVVLMEVGSEKSCYLTGTSIAFDHRGVESIVKVDLNDIYLAAAEKFGVTVADISECTY
jgi:hypothetical protein